MSPIQQWDDTDFYEVLGVSKTATVEEIKKVYRKLVMKIHPDHDKDKKHTEEFHIVQKAYEVLSDPDMRKFYDENGFVDGHVVGIEEEAKNMIRGWVVKMVDDFLIGDDMKFDPVTKILDIVGASRQNVKSQESVLDRRIRRTRKFLKRMKTEEYSVVIKQQLKAMLIQKADMLRFLRILESVESFASSIEYDKSDMNGDKNDRDETIKLLLFGK